MQQEKGQIQIILLVIAIVGIILYFNFFKPGIKIAPFAAPYSPEKTINIPSQGPPPTAPPNYSSNSSDPIPPFRSNPQPSGGLSAATRETTISLATDEKAVCRYGTVSGMIFGQMKVFSNTNSTFHYTSATGLNEGGGYNYYIKCADQSGNKNIDDFVIAFWVNYPIDFAPPVLSNAYPSGGFLSAGAFTMIGVSTDEPASCRYSLAQGTAYDSMSNSLSPADGTKRYHTAQITGFVPGNSYNYFVRCKDVKGNVNYGDVMIWFAVR